MNSDGKGGVLFVSNSKLFHVDTQFSISNIPGPYPDPKPNHSNASPFVLTASGFAWHWNGSDLIYRYSTIEGWKSAPVVLPSRPIDNCKLSVLGDESVQMSCLFRDSVNQSESHKRAHIRWPIVFPWKAILNRDSLESAPEAKTAFDAFKVERRVVLAREQSTHWQNAVLTYNLSNVKVGYPALSGHVGRS